jgi:hypothetical protein
MRGVDGPARARSVEAVTALVTAGAGFLLAVLWFDLMFDVQVLRHRRRDDLPEEVLGSIAAYYRRVTTAAAPMNRLIAGVMVATLAAIGLQISEGDAPAWVGWTSLALLGSAVLVAVLRVLPAAVRLGARTDGVQIQSRRARSICREHLLSLTAIAATLAIQLGWG